MRRVRALKRSLGIGLLLWGAAPAADAVPTLDDYLGRWNVWIFGETDTFSSSWLKVERTDDGPRAATVWKWGGVTPVRDVEVVGGELRLRRGRQVFRARLVGGELLGWLRRGKERRYFVGRRAPEMCEPGGTWKVVQVGDPADKIATLVLKEQDGKISGQATDPGGNRYALRDAELDGYVLRFRAVPETDEVPALDVRCEIRGDVIKGSATATGADGSDDRETLRFKGRREREWGKPVALLAEEGLDGWRPRDPNREFGWTVEGGVLKNSPPDVDIVSSRKFRDFRLHLEYRVTRGSNSGVYLRGRYELQILGDKEVRPHGNMAVYSRLSPRRNPMRAFDEWQEIDVTFIGRWLTVVLNGETVHDNEYLEGITGGAIDPWEGEPGPLLLQGDHGEVRFRNIIVTPAR